MPDPLSPPEATHPHFIGWLPMPRALARFFAPIAIGLLVGAAVLAGLLAFGQKSPGSGRWEDDRTTTFEGIAVAEPYAMLLVPDAGVAGGMRTVLLVEEGKHGAMQRVRGFDGRVVRASGTLLQRDGQRMLELLSGDDGLQEFEANASRAGSAPVTRIGRVTLQGEIVDSKCYLGAMKPGDGRTHKGCAVLCLRGGVPPLLVTRDPLGQRELHVLVDAGGGPLDPALFDRVGEPVELTGAAERWGNLSVLKVLPTGVRRVP